MITDKLITRYPIKNGIIAKCFYYACEEYYIMFSNKRLAQIFSIPREVVANGNNKINKQIKKNPTIFKCINKKPLTLKDYIHNISYLFTDLTESHVEII